MDHISSVLVVCGAFVVGPWVSIPWSGVQILQIKNEQGNHKPLSLLCKDISTMNTYAKGIDKVSWKRYYF